MIGVLISPGKFFDNLDNFGYKIVAAVAFLSAVPSALTQYLIISNMLHLFPPEIRPILQISSVFGIVISFIVTFILILVVAGIVHLISGFFGGEGEFVRTATVAGYGMIPSIILSYIQVGIFLYTLNQYGGFNSPQELIGFITDQTRITSNVILSVAGAFWSVAVMSSGISKIRKIQYSKALISCLIPFLLYLGYLIYGIYSIKSLENLKTLSAL